MMKKDRIGLLYGDGIGPEIMKATVEVLKAILRPYSDLVVEWVELPMGWEAIRLHNHPMPSNTIEALSTCHGWIMGPHHSASYPDEMKLVLTDCVATVVVSPKYLTSSDLGTGLVGGSVFLQNVPVEVLNEDL